MGDPSPGSSQIEHLIPAGVVLEPVQLSLVVPSLNEEITVGEFVDWCREGLSRAQVTGQILLVDSSTDRTREIALARGAEVLAVPKRGLGRAYIDSIPFIRGQWIIMGDADLTYDFRDLGPFVAQFRAGRQFVMGSRFLGTIEHGAMPALHQYFGTPLTTWIMNRIYRSHYTDIHCGMRGLTRDALLRIDLKSQSWEYASEMVLKAARLQLDTAEVPVSFGKDRDGRLSHHRRAGWFSPWSAGWLNLKVMLVYSPDTFLLVPGVILFIFGMLLAVPLAFGPITLGPIGLELHWMLLAVTCTVLGYSFVQVAVLARVMHGLRFGWVERFQAMLTYNRGMFFAAGLAATGLVLLGLFVVEYFAAVFKLSWVSYSAIFGLLLLIMGFQTFGFTLLLEMSRRVLGRTTPNMAGPKRAG